MSLETVLERIATALETIASGAGLATPAEPPKKGAKPPKPAPAAEAAPVTTEAALDPAPAPAPKVPTVADIQALVSKAILKNVRNGAVNILQAVGAKKASEVKPADITKVVANLAALIAETELAE